jgi:hypothetical protein
LRKEPAIPPGLAGFFSGSILNRQAAKQHSNTVNSMGLFAGFIS